MYSPMLAILEKMDSNSSCFSRIEFLRQVDPQAYARRCELYRKRIAYQLYGDDGDTWYCFLNKIARV
jgi:hypothetical protein